MSRPASDALHSAVRNVMCRAGEQAIMPRFGHLGRDDVREKAVNELVTVADRESEAILSDGLAAILPEATIVGEEAADAAPDLLRGLGDSLCWIIDPLDGTANFASGTGPFGILVALAEYGVAIGGWIYDPRSRRFCAASRGEGLTIDAIPVRSRASGERRPIAAISSMFASGERRDDIVGRICPPFTAVAIPRCAAEQYPRVILGETDITLFERTLAWDHAAGALCVAEAGGVVTRFDGTPYSVDDDRCGLIVAATPALWELAMQRLQPD